MCSFVCCVQYAADFEELEDKVTRQLTRAQQPRPSDVRFAFSGLPKGVACVAAPREVRTVFAGDAVVVHAQLDTRADVDDDDVGAEGVLEQPPTPADDSTLSDAALADVQCELTGVCADVKFRDAAVAGGKRGDQPLTGTTREFFYLLLSLAS